MAASKDEAKVRFTAETQGFNKAISDANSTLTKLRSELRLNATQMKATGESVELLEQRQKTLQTEAEASQSKIDALSQKLETARSIYGDTSEEVRRLETQLNNARTAHTSIETEITKVANALDQQKSAASEAESAMGRLQSTIADQRSELSRLQSEYSNVVLEQGESSDEAQKLARQIQNLNGDLQQNQKRLDDARDAADRLGREFDDAGDAARELGDDVSAMDVAIGNVAADAVTGLASSVTGLESSTRQFRNEQNKLEAVAQQSGQSLDALQQSYDALYAITADETLASTAVLNMSAMGMSVEDQMSIINSATGAWAAYGDSIPLDGLLESINESSRSATVTGSLADALNWANMTNQQWSSTLSSSSKAQSAFNKGIADGMTVEDAFNEALAACTTTQERQQIITAAMNGAYGALGTTYQSVNQDVITANTATSNLTQAQATLGEAIAPVTTAFTNLIAGGLEWIAANLPIIVPLVAGLAGGFVAMQVVTTIVPAVTALVTGLGGLAGVMALLTSPITLVVAAVALLAAGFVALWQNSETFRTGVQNVWATIQSVFGTLAEWLNTTVVQPVIQFFQSLAPQISEIWNGIGNIINTVITAISSFIQNNLGTIQAIWSNVWGAVSSVVSTVWGVIQTVIQTVLGVIQGIITTVTGVISGDWSQVWEGISQVFGSIWNGIKGTVEGIINGISSTIGSVLGGISSTVSGILDGIGGFFSNTFGGIGDTVSNVIDTAKNVISGGLDAISGFFKGLHIEFPKIKLPHFSISGSFSLNPLSVPHLSIEWYSEGGILTDPTVFGMNGSHPMVGGEAGPEAILPIEKLQGFIDVAMQRYDNRADIDRLISAVESLADRVISIEINGKQLARATASDADRVNGSRQAMIRRGLSI